MPGGELKLIPFRRFDCVAAGVRVVRAEKQPNLNAFVRGDFGDCGRPRYKLVVSSYNELFERCVSPASSPLLTVRRFSPLAPSVAAVRLPCSIVPLLRV